MRAPLTRDRRHYTAALIAIALSVGNLFLHKPISDVCDWARAQWGFTLYDRTAMLAIPILSVALALPFLLRRLPALRTRAVVCVLLSLTVISLAAQRWLLVANVELIHFPQFALLAALLLATGLTAEAAWLVATLAGIVDEVYQHLVIYAGVRGVYLDFNDMLLNAIGAAWAVVLLAPAGYAAFNATADTATRARWWRWPGGAVLLLLLVPLLAWWDRPEFVPFLRPTAAGALYRVLSAPEAMFGTVLLWGLVSLATTPEPADTVRHGRVAAAAVLLIAAGHILPAAAPAADKAPPFIITFWCGPPLSEFDDVRAAEIVAAGFTVAGPPCEGMRTRELNRRALDTAARHGLRLWVADHRFAPYSLDQPDWQDKLADAVADYRGHPALDGYFVVDEPTADAFPAVAAVVHQLYQHDPTRLAYVNLLPDYIPPEYLHAASYEAYVDEFISTVRPRLLSYDYYTFRAQQDRTTFFSNLALIRDRALRDRLPFLLIVLSMPHGSYRDPNEAELAWQLFHALAYGARGVSYFAYWTPVSVEHADKQRFRYGLIEKGQPTEHYFQAMRLNRELHALARELAPYRSLAIADSRGEVAAALPMGPLQSIDGGPITVGFFANDDGGVAALLVNRDYRYGVTARLGLRDSQPPELFDSDRSQWHPLSSPAVTLPPGHARLLRWPRR